MTLLLHACCAPCAMYPLEEAKKRNLSVTGFFYNPNIHPLYEYIRRKKELKRYFKSERLPFISGEYKNFDFFQNVKENASPSRCPHCWEMRIKETAAFAKKEGFAAFSTTLLGSPYQDHEVIKGICAEASRKDKIEFYYEDFRKGFKDAHRKAREKGVYCQNYCGCVFSIVEREEKVNEKRKTQNEKLKLKT